MPIPIIVAAIGLIGSAVGGGLKSDQANKSLEAQRKAQLAQQKQLRSNNLTDVMNYLSINRANEQKVLQWTLIAAAIAVAIIFWWATKKKKG